MNDQQGQRDEMFMDKNVSACDLPEIVVCNYKELTYKVVKDICFYDEGVPEMQEKLLFNEKGSAVKVNANPFESKSSEDSNFEEFVDTKDIMKLVVSGEEVKEDYEVYHEDGCEKSPFLDVLAKSSVSKEGLTLGDIIAMEDYHKAHNKNNINEPDQENVGREIRQKKTREPKADSWRYLSFEMDSYDHHHLLSRNFQRSFSEAESGLAHITYSGPISVSGSLSVRSDGSTIATGMEQQSCKNGES